jgi:hypothetical protein
VSGHFVTCRFTKFGRFGQNWTFWQKVSSTKVDPQATLNHISLLLGQFFTPAFVSPRGCRRGLRFKVSADSVLPKLLAQQ